MTEERWHNFAKEKPSEDMEGRNFIVSNGHYEKIATWCGYWENEPFMGDRLCDEVVRWKFYFTPEEEKANEATRTELKAMKCDKLKKLRIVLSTEGQLSGHVEWFKNVYNAEDVDEAIAELKARIQLDDDEMAGFLQLEEECGGGDLRKYIAELKQKLEDAKATAYAESVDAGMRERRLKRALWLTRAGEASKEVNYWICRDKSSYAIVGFNVRHEAIVSYKASLRHKPYEWILIWKEVERKCLAKAEEYK